MGRSRTGGCSAGREAIWVRSDIGQGRAGRSDLGAREIPEGIKGGNAEIVAQAAFGRCGIEPVTGQRAQGYGGVTPEAAQVGIIEDGVGQDNLTRLQPGDLGHESGNIALAEAETAGRDVDRGEPVAPGVLTGASAAYRHKAGWRARAPADSPR